MSDIENKLILVILYNERKNMNFLQLSTNVYLCYEVYHLIVLYFMLQIYYFCPRSGQHFYTYPDFKRVFNFFSHMTYIG